MIPTFDVVIVGGGPVGLFLACELRLTDVSVLVLEQEEDPRSALKQLPFGLRGLSVPTLDAFNRRGLLGEVASAVPPRTLPDGTPIAGAHWMQQQRRPGGHFAGLQFSLDNVDTGRWRDRLPGPVGTMIAVAMERLESVLAARAVALGVEVKRGHAVVTLVQDQDGVAVQAGTDTVRGRWLVGCDGGRSIVRKEAGFDFVGTVPEFTGYSVDAELANPDVLEPGRHHTEGGMYTFSQPGTIAMVEFDGGACHRTLPLTLAHVQAVLRRVSGKDVTLAGVRLATTWTDRAYQATEYRRGRVLLAGDAAHIHSPLGGQGLNLGLGDAMNLGWKLAATVRGDAPDELLDSYTAERHPAGAQILDWSRAQVALMRPGRSERALRAIMSDLVDTRDGATYFAERVWGVSQRYDLGGDHPLVGRTLPGFDLLNGTKLSKLQEDGRGLLLDFDACASRRLLAARWSDRIRYVANDATDRLGLSAILVRPDGIVVWAGETAEADAGAAEAASRWFGAPNQKGGRLLEPAGEPNDGVAPAT